VEPSWDKGRFGNLLPPHGAGWNHAEYAACKPDEESAVRGRGDRVYACSGNVENYCSTGIRNGDSVFGPASSACTHEQEGKRFRKVPECTEVLLWNVCRHLPFAW